MLIHLQLLPGSCFQVARNEECMMFEALQTELMRPGQQWLAGHGLPLLNTQHRS